MDNQKDFYIKEKFKQDDLISKNADDVFNNFLKGNLNMSNEEKVVDFKEKTQKKKGSKKWISLVASLLVVFLGANVYAVTQGYDNLFFMIKEITKNTIITDEEEILSVKEISISYDAITLSDVSKIQINTLTTDGNKGSLNCRVMLDDSIISNREKFSIPGRYIIYDITSEEKLLANIKSEEDKNVVEYTLNLELNDFSKDTSKIKLEIKDEKENLMKTIIIDLATREVTVIDNTQDMLEKISEVELKNILGSYALINDYNDHYKNPTTENLQETKELFSRDQIINYNKVNISTNYIYEKEYEENLDGNFTPAYTLEKVNTAIKELTGETITTDIDIGSLEEIAYGNLFYNKDTAEYEFEPGPGFQPASCLDIEKIEYVNGAYNVTFLYCYPGEEAYIDGNFNVYRTTMNLQINDNYEYIKYRIVNFDTLESELVKEGTMNY